MPGPLHWTDSGRTLEPDIRTISTKESAVSHLRVIICQVDDDTGEEPVSELSRFDLPPVPVDLTAALDRIEALVARVGQCVLGRLLERQWEQLDAQAVARYCAHQPPGSVVADGYETLLVATRFGSVQLRRQVCAHRDGRPHVMPGNDLVPDHHGLLITRGLQEVACLLAHDVPFATAARLLGWYTDEPGVLSATTVRQVVRERGADPRPALAGRVHRAPTPAYGLAGRSERGRRAGITHGAGATAGGRVLERLGAGAGRPRGGR